MLFTTPPFTSLSTLCFALSYLPLPRSIVDWFASFGLTEGERRGLARGREFKKSGSGYQVRSIHQFSFLLACRADQLRICVLTGYPRY